jgi:predicted nucleic acid-binding Zn ribbon protein
VPAYNYQCLDCGAKDRRIAGLDDHTALCIDCGSLMLRLDQDLFAAYFQEIPLESGNRSRN